MTKGLAVSLLAPKHGLTKSIGPALAATSLDLASFHGADDWDAAAIFSFHYLEGCDHAFLPFDACTRLSLAAGQSQVVVVAAQSAASYADLVLWDLAHALPVGGTLTTIEPAGFADSILFRRYFLGVFEISQAVEQSWTRTSFRKVAPTLSEAEAGLRGWTFGLPVGDASPALIDRLVAEIEQLELDHWELVLVTSGLRGTDPPRDLPPQVRVVPCGSVRITEKKNEIARQAAYPNLCIFHDRVELPRNFRRAIERFGDHYAICGFQHLFLDGVRDSFQRYSDYHIDLYDGRSLIDVEGDIGDAGLYVNALMTRLRFRARFAEAHPAEYDRRSYLTGSCYLVKRAVWRLIEQQANLDWNQLEDVEFGERAAAEFGVPSRINPYGFGFTSRVRAVLMGPHEVANRRPGDPVVRVETNYRVGTVSTQGSGIDPQLMRQRAWELFKAFGLPEFDAEARAHIFGAPLDTPRQYAYYWVSILYRLALPRRASRIKQLLTLFSVAAFGSAYDTGTLSGLAQEIGSGAFFIDQIIRDNYFMRSMANVPNLVNPPPRSAESILFEQAMRIWRRGGDYIYPYASFGELWTVLNESLGLLPAPARAD
jgi:hypothetical protein